MAGDLTSIIEELYNKCRAVDEVYRIIDSKSYNKEWEQELEKWLEKYSKTDDYGTCMAPDFS